MNGERRGEEECEQKGDVSKSKEEGVADGRKSSKLVAWKSPGSNIRKSGS